MNDELAVVSYTLAAMAGICFISGLAILSGGRVKRHGPNRISDIHVRRGVKY